MLVVGYICLSFSLCAEGGERGEERKREEGTRYKRSPLHLEYQFILYHIFFAFFRIFSHFFIFIFLCSPHPLWFLRLLLLHSSFSLIFLFSFFPFPLMYFGHNGFDFTSHSFYIFHYFLGCQGSLKAGTGFLCITEHRVRFIPSLSFLVPWTGSIYILLCLFLRLGTITSVYISPYINVVNVIPVLYCCSHPILEDSLHRICFPEFFLLCFMMSTTYLRAAA